VLMKNVRLETFYIRLPSNSCFLLHSVFEVSFSNFAFPFHRFFKHHSLEEAVAATFLFRKLSRISEALEILKSFNVLSTINFNKSLMIGKK